ncbi:TlyA family RNA methyltransferase [Caldimonas sp. KR1-144]|uniref:TlyA family RNA methyltransferase n=1 Tax=Caldimonas sp. KR1-144 TaxID=3400911 RepID=UPI003C03150F
MRADQLLVERGLAASRSQAQRLIAAGVEWEAGGRWQRVAKNGDELPAHAPLRLLDDAEARWVSRGGLKLDGALARTGLDVTGRVCLDVGQSTGGFTEVLLARGAARVVGFDVGHGQLHDKLRGDARVVPLEGLHLRELAGSELAAHAPEGGFDLVVADLSFISLAANLAHLAPWLKAGGDALLLVKPQFEVGPQHVGKGGIVKDPAQYARVEAAVREACAALRWTVRDWFESTIAGGGRGNTEGNTEYFVWAQDPAKGPSP